MWPAGRDSYRDGMDTSTAQTAGPGPKTASLDATSKIDATNRIEPTKGSATADPEPEQQTRRGTWFVLVGIILYLCEFVGFAIAGGYPSNEPGTPLDQIPAAYVGFENGAGFLVGWMALVLTGRILIVVGLRSVIGRSPLLDWAVAAMVVSVALEVVSVGAMAAAAALVANGAAVAAVAVADQLAWTLGSAVTTAGGVAALLAAVAMWRSGLFPRVLAASGVVLGAVMLASGLLAGAPATYPVASTLSIVVLFWFVWVVWTGVLLARRAVAIRAGLRPEK